MAMGVCAQIGTSATRGAAALACSGARVPGRGRRDRHAPYPSFRRVRLLVRWVLAAGPERRLCLLLRRDHRYGIQNARRGKLTSG